MRKRNNKSILIKTPDQVELARVAGQLAADVLTFIAPHVKPGVSTDKVCSVWPKA